MSTETAKTGADDSHARGATYPQVRAIYAYGHHAGMDDAAVEHRCMVLYGAFPDSLSRRQAAELIDVLRKDDRRGWEGQPS